MGVIGTGAIAQEAYLPAIARDDSARLACVVDIDEDRAWEMADRFEADEAVADATAMTDAVEAAVIATPPSSHADIAQALLGANVHVMTEKPVATTSERARELVDLADERDRIYAISRQLRESPASRTMRSFCHNGMIGEPHTASIRFGDETRWSFASDYRLREDLAWGGVLTDKAPHALDLVCWLFGGGGEVVRYCDDSLGGLEANAEMELSFDATDVSLEITADRNIQNVVTIEGESGTITGDPNGSDISVVDRDGEKLTLTSTYAGNVDRFRPRVIRQLDRFLDAVRGETSSYVHASDGVRIVEWIESAYAIREQLVHPWEELITAPPLPEVTHDA